MLHGYVGWEGKGRDQENIIIQVKSSNPPSPFPQAICNDRSLNGVFSFASTSHAEKYKKGNEIFRNRL